MIGKEHGTITGEEHGTITGEEHGTMTGKEHGTMTGKKHGTMTIIPLCLLINFHMSESGTQIRISFRTIFSLGTGPYSNML